MARNKNNTDPESQRISDNGHIDDQVLASTQNSSLIEKRHRQIVEGACKIFFEKGYHPTTTREIARACGMSVGQLYHYISSKDDVLYLVHKYSQNIWYDYLKKSNMEHIEDPVEKLYVALHHSLIFTIENKKLIQFIYSESKYLDKKYLREVLELDRKNVLGFWRDLLEDVNRKIPLTSGDLDFYSSTIGYLIAFFALRGWTLDSENLEGKNKEKYIEELVSFIIKGLGLPLKGD